MEAKTKKKMFGRLPVDVDSWIEERAKIEDRSRTMIVLRALRAQMQAQQKRYVPPGGAKEHAAA